MAIPQLDMLTTGTSILEKWRISDNGYFFHPDQLVGLYNTTRVLYGCQQVAVRFTSGVSTVVDLLNYPPDPNTKVADATLRLLARSAHASSVFTDAIQQHQHQSQSCLVLSSPYPLPRFRLATLLGELDSEDRSALLSFVWYLGGLTCVRGKPGVLAIPNATAREEIMVEARSLFDWMPRNPQSYRDAVLSLFKTPPQAYILCKLVQEHQFQPLKDNQVVHNNEAAVLQAFLAAFILPFEFSGAEPEFRVSPRHSTPHAPGMAIDLVELRGGKCVALEFMNVLSWYIMSIPGGRKRPFADFSSGSWQMQTSWSREIATLDDKELLECRILQHTDQVSLESLVIDKKKTVLEKYYDKLALSQHSGQLHSVWVICRVGLHRVYCSEVKP